MEYKTRIHRLFRLITLIQGTPGYNAKRLAELFEISERQIFRDVQILRDSGVPITPDPETGGYSIRKDFFLRPVDLTLEEAMALLMLADCIGAPEQLSHAGEAGKAAEKIRAILPRPIGEILNEMMPRVNVALARAANDEGAADVYTQMRDAIVNRRAVECLYESSNAKSPQNASGGARFRFDPFALYFGQRAWYAVGRHHGHDEIRTLKLSRFTHCKSLDKPYFIPDEFSLESHFGKAWRMVPSASRTIHAIQLHFDKTMAETVADTHWHDSQETYWHDDDSITMRFQVDGLEEIIWWIMGYGPHCRVVEPAELAIRVRNLQKSAADQYATDAT